MQRKYNVLKVFRTSRLPVELWSYCTVRKCLPNLEAERIENADDGVDVLCKSTSSGWNFSTTDSLFVRVRRPPQLSPMVVAPRGDRGATWHVQLATQIV